MRKMLALGTASLFISLGGALLASAGAYADDPTGVLLSEQRWYNGPAADPPGTEQFARLLRCRAVPAGNAAGGVPEYAGLSVHSSPTVTDRRTIATTTRLAPSRGDGTRGRRG